jgi:hypothetical protein
MSEYDDENPFEFNELETEDTVDIPMDLIDDELPEVTPTRGRGRPRKVNPEETTTKLIKRRGRPPKNKSVVENEPKLEEESALLALAEKQETNDNSDENLLLGLADSAVIDVAAPKEVKRRGRPPKSGEKLADTAPKKRGRPAKPETVSSVSADYTEFNESDPQEEASLKSEIKPEKVTAKPEESKLAVFHDPRAGRVAKSKLQDAQEKWHGKQNIRNTMMDNFVAAAKEKFGATRVFGSRKELEQLCVGIPTPSLPMEYVIANDILPFALIMLAGSWGSCKTSLLFEFFRWVYESNGIEFHVDVEHKFDGDFACNIMRAPPGLQPYISNRAHSTEEWQNMLTHYANEAKKALTGTKEEPGPGLTVPVAMGLDSLAAGLSEEIQDKVFAAGHAGRAHPVDALKNKNFINAFVPQMADWPFMLLIVNHLKTKTDDQGIEHKYTLGGGNVNFRESIELHNSVWKSKFKNNQFEGIGVKIACAKNSFGPTHRSIKTRFIWWYEEDPNTGELIQQVTWDWDWSICDLLNSAEGIYKKRLQDRGINIKTKSPTADVECMANLTALGMGKEEYLNYQEVGRMIHENPKICADIREALSIKVRPKLINGIALDKIVQQQREAAE